MKLLCYLLLFFTDTANENIDIRPDELHDVTANILLTKCNNAVSESKYIMLYVFKILLFYSSMSNMLETEKFI